MLILSFYLTVLVIAGYWVIKTLAPEMAKPPLVSSRPRLKKALPRAVSTTLTQTNETSEKRIEKLEMLLAEKNNNIELLQKDLRILIVQVNSFDKLKKFMEEEIHRLREQNHMFRSELGLPNAQEKEKSIS